MNCKVSIIMNCFNGSDYLKNSLKSVIEQTYQNWELIFWDNQSTDNSAKIFLSYNDNRFKYFLSKEHTPLAEARNLAIKNSVGELIAFLDVDDFWLPEKLESQIKLFDDKSVGLSYSNFYLYFQDKKHSKISYSKIQPSGFIINKLLINYNIAFLTVILRKQAYEDLNEKFNPKFSVIEDLDIILRISLEWKIKYLNSPLGYCRIHSKNYQRKFFNQKILEFEKIIINFNKEKKIYNLKEYKIFKNKIVKTRLIYDYIMNDKKIVFKDLFKLKKNIDFFHCLILMILPKSIIIKYLKKRNPYL